MITYGEKPQDATANPTADISYSWISKTDTSQTGTGWPTNAGTYTVTASVAESENYNRATATLTISPKTVTATVSVTPEKYEYTGQPIIPAAGNVTVTCQDGSQTITIDRDEYTFTCSNNINVGTATLTLSDADGNYIVSGTGSFEITQPLLDTAKVTLGQANFTYDGTAKEPTVTVEKAGSTVDPSEYTISYSNSNGTSGDHTNAGTVTVTITAKTGGNYDGSNTATFTIDKATLTPTISGSTTKTYDGSTNATGLSITLTGVVNGDTVTVSGSSYIYNSPNVKDAKTIPPLASP